ncbi:uncharacterized protein PgNI_03333, partial [Pyricularia grisea]|uniref:Uncharacterized protein n=1 Tax=Pyricularia grisea TaxID=148305 RepID=A0A6P8BCS9_PYRGI
NLTRGSSGSLLVVIFKQGQRIKVAPLWWLIPP